MITSSQNAKVQRIRALLSRRQEREEARAFVVEGVRLAEEALAAGLPPGLVLYSAALSGRGRNLLEMCVTAGAEIEEVDLSLLDSVSATETSQGLVAVFPLQPLALPSHPNFVLIADQVRDPGNLGTLLRTAAAAGVQTVLLAPGTTDAYAPKVLRAAMGGHFRLPLQMMNWDEIVKFCKPQLKIYLAETSAGTPCWQVDFRQGVALVVGGESTGASPQAHRVVDALVTIPMPGQSESLNAAVAASILLFEIVRQRISSLGPAT